MPSTLLPVATFRSHVQTIEDLRGPAGRLEALLNTGTPDALYAALVAHPHPLGGGTMHNKVVYHTAKAFSYFGLPTLRFHDVRHTCATMLFKQGVHPKAVCERLGHA